MTSLYGNYRTRTFTNIYPDETTFHDAFRQSGLNVAEFTDASINILYYQLYAAYGNSHIASSDENQFKYKLYSIIMNKGLVWQKNVEIQQKLQKLTDKEILTATSMLTSHAFNPGEGGVKDGLLDYINDQSSTSQSGSMINSLVKYMESLVDITTDFIREFKKLFIVIVNPELPLVYGDDDCGGGF